MCFDIGSRHLGCWGQNTSRIQNREVYATLCLQGTYAGNDAIVAFARSRNINVVVHQLKQPPFTVMENSDPQALSLHLGYHDEIHYSSLRKSTEDDVRLPACRSMLCLLCCAVLCCAVCCAVQSVLCCAVPCCAVLCRAVLCLP